MKREKNKKLGGMGNWRADLGGVRGGLRVNMIKIHFMLVLNSQRINNNIILQIFLGMV